MKTHFKYPYRIFDAHCDTLSRIIDHGGNAVKNSYNLDLSRAEAYDEYTQVFACFIAPEYRDTAMERFIALADSFSEQIGEASRHILSVEGAEMIKSVEDVDYLYSRDVRCVALTWNGSNSLAGGADNADRGLTELGKSVVKRMNELGILIDVSHLNDKSFYDIAEVNEGILAATHSNARAVCNHRRNLTDDMFKIICETGGCAGLNLYPTFLTEENICSSDDVLRHIEHWLILGGENNIGLGTDFDGTDDMLPLDIKGAEDLYILLDKIKKEFGTEITEKISNKNWKRVFIRRETDA